MHLFIWPWNEYLRNWNSWTEVDTKTKVLYAEDTNIIIDNIKYIKIENVMSVMITNTSKLKEEYV